LITLWFTEIINERNLIVVTHIVRISSRSPCMMWFTVVYFLACTMPLIFLTLSSHTNLHTRTIKRSWLREVTNVKFYFSITHNSAFILYTKVKPLMMTSRVCIDSHKQIILIFTSLNYHVQVTWFKIWVKL